MIERGGCQWRASEIGVENDPCRVDDRTQRITERLLQLPFDRIRQAAQCEVKRLLIQLACRNLLPQMREHNSGTFRNRSVAVSFSPGLDFWLTKNLISGWELLEECRV